jgi:hypothetical protein
VSPSARFSGYINKKKIKKKKLYIFDGFKEDIAEVNSVYGINITHNENSKVSLPVK